MVAAARLDLSSYDLVELVGAGQHAAQGRVVINDTVKNGAVPVDAIARQVPQTSTGDR